MQGLQRTAGAAIEAVPDYFLPRRLRLVNRVRLGLTETPLFVRVPEKHPEAFIRAIPMWRLAKPAEIAHAGMFFVSARLDILLGKF